MNNIKNRIIIALIVFLSSLTCLFLVLIYLEKTNVNSNLTTKNTVQEETGETKKEKTYPSDLTGKIYLTLKEKTTGKMGIYSFDLDKNKLEEIYVPEGCSALGGEVSPTKNEMVISSDCNIQEGLANQVKILNLDTKIPGDYVTKTNSYDKKEMAWSEDGGKIVFSTKSQGGDGSRAVYLKDINNQEVEKPISVGSYPLFLENKVLTVSGNQVLAMNYEKNSGRSIEGLEISAGSKIDLSKNKNFLLVKDSQTSNINIFEFATQSVDLLVENQNRPERISLKKYLEINSLDISNNLVSFYSNSENYLVYSDNKSLNVYDIKNQKKYNLINLDDYSYLTIQ